MSHWLLPEFIEDVLPEDAACLETLRRNLLDILRQRGYDLVIPPMIEFIDALLTNAGPTADLRTFKLTDQMSGRIMGIRADITPQIARIDAHLLGSSDIVRLCYAGSVLHTLPASYLSTRQPFQIGAELFGHSGIDSDHEIIRLAASLLRAADLDVFQIDIGHVGLFKAIADAQNLSHSQRSMIFEAIRTKDISALDEITREWPADIRKAVLSLVSLYGDKSILKEAQKVLPSLPGISESLNQLSEIAERMENEAIVTFDLSQLRTYQYHTGIIFSAYSPNSVERLCLGGRYDGIGEAFGRRRPATGFNIDLRTVLKAKPKKPTIQKIYSPKIPPASSLAKTVETLREKGHIVIEGYEIDGSDVERQGCSHILRKSDGQWQIFPL